MKTFAEYISPDKTTEYKPSDIAPMSGIYRVTHDTTHKLKQHEVTMIEGKKFPPCGHCKHPRFKIVRAAIHISSHEALQRKTKARS